MPNEKMPADSKAQTPQSQPKPQTPPNGTEKAKPVADKPEPPAKPRAEKSKPDKDETLKYEMVYANGGFNDGVEIKPAKNGKVELTISLYGGGEIKSMGISPLPPNLAKLVRAYEISATNDDNSTPEITDGLKRELETVKVKLSVEIMQIMQEADKKIEASIKNMFKTN